MLSYLREQTTTLHKEIEETNLAKYIIDSSITLDQYKKLLLKNYICYKTLEDTLIANKQLVRSEFHPFIAQRKSDYFFKDLSFWGDVSIPQINNLKITSEAEAIAIIYVIEGSMLGSALIANKIGTCSELKNIKEHHFYGNYIKSNKTNWKTFKNLVNEIEFTKNDIQKALAAAKNAFLCFK